MERESNRGIKEAEIEQRKTETKGVNQTLYRDSHFTSIFMIASLSVIEHL